MFGLTKVWCCNHEFICLHLADTTSVFGNNGPRIINPEVRENVYIWSALKQWSLIIILKTTHAHTTYYAFLQEFPGSPQALTFDWSEGPGKTQHIPNNVALLWPLWGSYITHNMRLLLNGDPGQRPPWCSLWQVVWESSLDVSYNS